MLNNNQRNPHSLEAILLDFVAESDSGSSAPSETSLQENLDEDTQFYIDNLSDIEEDVYDGGWNPSPIIFRRGDGLIDTEVNVEDPEVQRGLESTWLGGLIEMRIRHPCFVVPRCHMNSFYRVTVRYGNNISFMMCCASDRFEHLKCFVYFVFRLELNTFYITFQGFYLDDQASLGACGIGDGDVVDVYSYSEILAILPSKRAVQPRRPGYLGMQLCDHRVNNTNLRLQSGVVEKYELQGGLRDFLFESSIWANSKLHEAKDFYEDIDQDYVVKLFEDVFICLENLSRAKSARDYSMAVITFVKLRCKGPLLCKERIDMVVEYFFQIFPELNSDVQSGVGFLSSARDLLDKFDAFKKSVMYKKLYKFLMYALSLSLFESVGITFKALNYGRIEREIIKQKYHMGPDFFHSLIDTLIFVCERGHQCMITGSLDPIYHSGAKYELWAKEAVKLKQESQFLSNPEPHGVNRFEYLNRLNDAIEKGEAIKKFANLMGDFEKRLVGGLLNDLILIKKNEITKRAAQRERKAPFAVLLYGGSSVAKSTFTKMLYYHYGKIFDLPIGSEYKYTRNPADEFWSNFNSTQWCVQMDDVAFMHPNKAMNGDPSLMEMLQVVNNVPFVPAQADLADKGRTPVQSRLVIATTNTENLNAFAYFSCPLAVRRRLPFVIDIQPKSEYLKDDVMLDPELVPAISEGEYPDYWIITVKRIIPFHGSVTEKGGGDPRRGQRAITKEIATFDNIYDFIAWFSKQAKEYEVIQEKAMKCDETMSNVEVCQTCFRPKEKACACGLQSGSQQYNFPYTNEVLRNRRIEQEDNYFNAGQQYTCHYNSWDWTIAGMFYYILAWLYVFSLPCAFLIWKLVGPERFVRNLMDFAFDERTFSLLFKAMGTRVESKIGKYKNILKLALLLTSSAILYKATVKVMKWAMGVDYVQNCDDVLMPRTRIVEDDYIKTENGCLIPKNRLPKKVSIGVNTDDLEIQVGEQERISETIGSKPIARDVERENVWYKNDYQTTTFDVSPQNISWKALSSDDIHSILQRNVVILRSVFADPQSGEMMCEHTNAVCLQGHIYMANNHAVKEFEDMWFDIRERDEKDGVTNKIVFKITQSEIYRYPEHDIAIFQLRNIPPKKNITMLFSKDSLDGGMKGCYVGRDQDTKAHIRQVANIQKRVMQITELDREFTVWRGLVDDPTSFGDCGTLMVAHTSYGPILLGVHILGSDKTVAAVQVTQTMISKFMKPFGEQHVQNGVPELSSKTQQRELTSLNKKSPVRYIQRGIANVYGSFAGFRVQQKSKVKPTLICDSMIRRGYSINAGPPVMKGWKPGYIALKDMVNPVTQIDVSILQDCVKHFTNDILSGLSEEDLASVKVYDNMTAINGAAGVAYVDRINRNTSAGNPWKRSKKYFLREIAPVDDLQHPVEVDDEIMDRVDRMIEKYRMGIRCMPNFCEHLKDEARSIAKIKSSETRAFCGAPFDWTILNRKFTLSFVRLIQNNKFLFECAVGTVAQSTEWQRIMEEICAFGEDGMFAGDHKKFDKRMASVLILAAFDILIAIAEAAGWSKEDILVLRGIAEDTAFPLVDFFGDLIEFFGTNPSGHPLTVIINCIVNSLYMRYCYTVLSPNRSCEDFKRFVKLMVYGDDNTGGVHKLIRSWFNHTTIQTVMKSLDLDYTMADKESESVPFINIRDVTFLKRRWRYDADVGAYLCPLEHDSINKMLTMCVESKTITAEEQCIDIIGSAVREYFFYGKEIFEEKSAMLKDVVEEKGLQYYLKDSTFPSWINLFNQFWENSKRICGDSQPGPIVQGPLSQNAQMQHSYCSEESVTASKSCESVGVVSFLPGRSPKSLFREELAELGNSQ